MLEVEAKFVLPPGFDLARITTLSAVAGFPLSPIQIVNVHDTYLETVNKDVEALGYVARLRIVDGTTRLITVKSRASSGGAVSMREEHEFAIQTDYQPQAWPDTLDVKSKFVDQLQQRPLQPYFEIRQRREQRLLIEQDAPVAELTLDYVQVWCENTHLEGFSVLEIELIDASAMAIMDAILVFMRSEFSLESVAVAKLARAEAAVIEWKKNSILRFAYKVIK